MRGKQTFGIGFVNRDLFFHEHVSAASGRHVSTLASTVRGSRVPRTVGAAAETALAARGDARRLFRAVRDLIDNALKFSPGREEVAVSAFRDGDRCVVQVIDRGIGVPRAELPSLGQRWFRAGNADWRMYPGLGLGLAIARETLRLHGGALSFESDAGQGLTATLSLPAA